MTDKNLSANKQNNLQHSNKQHAIKKVDVVICGKPYTINCPVNEEEELHAAIAYINEFLTGIKKEAPNLNQENLLVLCCLNLYSKIHEQQQTDNSQKQVSQESTTLLDKILKDAKSILSTNHS